jgi:hypothetical protein
LNLRIGVVEYRKDFGGEALGHLVTTGAPVHQQDPEAPEQAPSGSGDQNQKGEIRCLTCGKPLQHASCFCESCLTDSEAELASA